jgi:surface antigen
LWALLSDKPQSGANSANQIAALQESFLGGNGTNAIERNGEPETWFTDATSRIACGADMHSQDGWAVSHYVVQAQKNDATSRQSWQSYRVIIAELAALLSFVGSHVRLEFRHLPKHDPSTTVADHLIF